MSDPRSVRAPEDDWDSHWTSFGEAATGNPANDYRRRVVLELLGDVPAGATLVDIGCGQGAFAVQYAVDRPDVQVAGVEYSAEGVRRARAAAEGAGAHATFHQRDLLAPTTAPLEDVPLGTHAVCSEVLEHVDDPVALLRNTTRLLEPGARVVITVPGGPRSAFDKAIGHEEHFTPRRLANVVTDSGLVLGQVFRTGFPFFNLYKLAVVARGERLVRDMADRTAEGRTSMAERAATTFFKQAFRFNRLDAPGGWQLAAVAHAPRTSG